MVLDLPLDEFVLYLESVEESKAVERANAVADTVFSIACAFSSDKNALPKYIKAITE